MSAPPLGVISPPPIMRIVAMNLAIGTVLTAWGLATLLLARG